jgi:ABC-type Mn2+/Zn2+ transport system permease subunit
MLAAMGFCLAYCFAGLALSYTLVLSSGATIVIVAVVCYFVLSLFKIASYPESVSTRDAVR